jgi:hypothetical protein
MIDYSTIPDWVRSEIDEWAAIATWPGTFVEAVLKNELNEAFALSTEEDLPALHSIVAYVYNYVPSPCWRSREKMTAWRGTIVEFFDANIAKQLEENGGAGAGTLAKDREGEIRRALAAELIANQRQRSIGIRQSG